MRGSADIGIGCNQVLLRGEHVGTPFDQRRGQAGGTCGAPAFQSSGRAGSVPARGRVNSDQVFLCSHLPFGRRNRGNGLLVLRFDLRHFDLRRPRRPAGLEDLQRTFVVRRRRPSNFQLCDPARAQGDRPTRRSRRPSAAYRDDLPRSQTRACAAFALAPHPAEQVDLPIGADRTLVLFVPGPVLPVAPRCCAPTSCCG